MAKTTTLPVTQTIKNPVVAIVNATSFSATNPGTSPTNTVLFATAGSEGSVLKSIIISSDDSSARTVQFWLSLDSGTTKYLIGTVVVAALSGTATLTNIDVLGNSIIAGLALDSSGRPVLGMEANSRIYVNVITSAVTASKTVWVTGQQEDY